MKIPVIASLTLTGLLSLSPAFGEDIFSLHPQDPADAQIANAELFMSSAQKHADRLTSFKDDQGLSFEAYADELTRIKDDVNNLGKTIKKLNDTGNLTRLQKDAVKRMDTLGVALAKETTDALDQLNKYRDPKFAPPRYNQDIQNIYSNSKKLDASLRQIRHLEEVKHKEHKLDKEEHQLSKKVGS